MKRLLVGAAAVLALGVAGECEAMPAPPSKALCKSTRAATHMPAIVSKRPRPGAPRVFAIQFKQELRHVETFHSFRTKIECMIRQYVVPRRARHRPNVAVFNEDVGLMTIATGSRGAAARRVLGDPSSAPSCEPQGAPCAALAALEAITASYALPLLTYRARFPAMGAIAQSFVAPTDTFARGWMQVFSDMARRYGIYIIGSNTQAPFRESHDPGDIATFANPDRASPKSVFVAAEGKAYNSAFIWGPRTVHPKAARPLRNVVRSNRKVPVTPLEAQLEVSDGPAGGKAAIRNLRPFRVPGTRARLGIATSLPAFIYGYPFGAKPQTLDPCSDVTLNYMRCLDRLGANVVIQDEANPGRWAALGGQGAWQPLEWMGSTWRAVADRGVGFAYNVTPFMTGNLADIAFDGQTAITQRRPTSGRRCTFIGDRRRRDSDPGTFRRYSGPKRRFLAIAPWVAHGPNRAAMRATSAALAPGSGDTLENDYVETAVIADFTFPVARGRRGCLRGQE